jgi:hypothetical protein
MNIRHVLFGFVLLAGCASGSVQLVPQPDESVPPADPQMTRVYLFRVPGSLSPQAPLNIEISGKPVGSIRGGHYLVLDLPSGLQSIRMELARKLEKPLVGTDYGDLKPGVTFYGGIDFPITGGRRPKLTSLSERDGKARIEKMKPADLQLD